MLTLIPLKFYTTSNCHLCEQASDMLSALRYAGQITTVEIANDDDLITTYGTRIPVLQRTDNQDELNWPFSEGDIMAFIK